MPDLASGLKTDHNEIVLAIREVSVQADSLSQLARLDDVEERRSALLDRLDRAFELAATRSRVGKGGQPIRDPDCHALIKCVEVAAKLLGCERAPAPAACGLGLAIFAATTGDAQ
jgi:hypothetical protein